MGFISEDIRVARKECTCYLCGLKIKKGDKYRRSFFSDGDRVYYLSEHKECADLIPELDAACLLEMGEYSDDDFSDAISEVCRSEICPKCPLWDKECEECKEDRWIVKECMDKVWEFGKTHTYQDGKWVLWNKEKKHKVESSSKR